MSATLSLTDLAQYRRDGFIVLRQAVAPSAIQACLDDLKVIFNQAAALRRLPVAAMADLPSISRTMTALFKVDMPAYLATARLAQHMAPLHRLGTDPVLMAPLKALGFGTPVISTRPVLFIIADALKVPGGYHKTPPHQDWRSIQGSLDSVVFWVPFAAVGGGNYSLEVLPGSHLQGILPNIEDPFLNRIDPAAAPEDGFVPLELSLGDAVLFSSFLVHRTGEAGGAVARMAASFRFNNAAEPHFIARNYPNPYIYRPDMTVITPDFPSLEQLAEVFAPVAGDKS